MSAGHPHNSPNMRSPKEVERLMTEGGAPELMKRWQEVDDKHDIHDVAGYNVAGTIRYIDQDLIRALFEPDYATKIIGKPIDTGMSPEDTIHCLMVHEATEKVLLDADNPIDLYIPAHECATIAEHEEVRKRGGSPVKYERGLAAIIKYCEAKRLKNPPLDLACAPMLDAPDEENDKRAIKKLKAAGVEDATKMSRDSVDYGRSTSDDCCDQCKHWQQSRTEDLSTCAIVDGLVRGDRWCKKFDDVSAQKEPEPPVDPHKEVKEAIGAHFSELSKTLTDGFSRMTAPAPVNVTVNAPEPRKRKKTVTTRRDDKGNLVADVVEEDDAT